MNPSLIKPALIVLTGLFIVVMLNGCVVVPAEPVAHVAPAPAYGHQHHHRGHRHWRRGWTK
jgi:hypothetical protein